MAKKSKSSFSLISLDNEGEWNRPLLENAAAISDANCFFASSEPNSNALKTETKLLDDILDEYPNIIACEIVRDSFSIFDFPAPRQKTAVLVGNEICGIPRAVLKKANRIVSIPMFGSGMSSVNVAVSAAITLYVLSRDIARMKKIRSKLAQRNIDFLINAPIDPHELGSLLRSAWSFGWKKVFLNDPNGVWFTKNKETMLDSRAAARRFKNPIVVSPFTELNFGLYDHTVVCGVMPEGQPLSRFHMPFVNNLLVIYGNNSVDIPLPSSIEHIYVDFVDQKTTPCFRHQGSILLAIISSLLRI